MIPALVALVVELFRFLSVARQLRATQKRLARLSRAVARLRRRRKDSTS